VTEKDVLVMEGGKILPLYIF